MANLSEGYYWVSVGDEVLDCKYGGPTTSEGVEGHAFHPTDLNEDSIFLNDDVVIDRVERITTH